jgi:hypothetical protein
VTLEQLEEAVLEAYSLGISAGHSMADPHHSRVEFKTWWIETVAALFPPQPPPSAGEE